MIDIVDKYKCCGCSACQQVCPRKCISFEQDTEGFFYPIVNKQSCINCGLCEKVCPCINQNSKKLPVEVYVATNENNNIRLKSSSGGIFSVLADYIIERGGVVFGARYDEDWKVVHDYVVTSKDISVFRGSKYVQSYLGDTYLKVQSFLKEGKNVLFSGTPCQIAGLKKFLRKKYDNLFTIDIVCHGVPSQKVWKSYLEYVNPNNLKITQINLRDKSRGWKNYSYLIKSGNKTLVDNYAFTSLYSKAFALNLTLRPSCYKCPTKSFKSGSDITLADCWGIDLINDYKNDNMGVSTIFVNTHKAKDVLEKINIKKEKIDYSFIKENNSAIERSSMEPYCRKMFWKLFATLGIKAVLIISNKLDNPVFRLYNKIRTKIKK